MLKVYSLIKGYWSLWVEHAVRESYYPGPGPDYTTSTLFTILNPEPLNPSTLHPKTLQPKALNPTPFAFLRYLEDCVYSIGLKPRPT